MSNEALWITSGASPMKARNSSTMSANSGLSVRNRREPVHLEGLVRHVALRIEVAVKHLAGRHAVEQLDAADLDQPIAAQRIEAGGFGVENDFAHGVSST